MGQSRGILLKKVAAFQGFPLIEVLLYNIIVLYPVDPLYSGHLGTRMDCPDY